MEGAQAEGVPAQVATMAEVEGASVGGGAAPPASPGGDRGEMAVDDGPSGGDWGHPRGCAPALRVLACVHRLGDVACDFRHLLPPSSSSSWCCERLHPYVGFLYAEFRPLPTLPRRDIPLQCCHGITFVLVLVVLVFSPLS